MELIARFCLLSAYFVDSFFWHGTRLLLDL